MNSRISVSFALPLTLAAGSAWAHHNMSANFDFNQRFTRTGTLAKTDWRNPHIYLSVDVKSDQGPVEKVETWLFEGPSPGVFRNLKVGKSDFENAAGKIVTVEASRARDGSLSGLIRILTLPDGTVVSLCPQNC
jgi:hypothetical protein